MFVSVTIALVLSSLWLMVVLYGTYYVAFKYPGSLDETFDRIKGHTYKVSYVKVLLALGIWLVLLATFIELY